MHIERRTKAYCLQPSAPNPTSHSPYLTIRQATDDLLLAKRVLDVCRVHLESDATTLDLRHDAQQRATRRGGGRTPRAHALANLAVLGECCRAKDDDTRHSVRARASAKVDGHIS